MTYLARIGVTETERDSLAEALKEDREDPSRPGPRVRGWIARVGSAIGSTSADIGAGVAGSLVATAIMKYLGMS